MGRRRGGAAPKELTPAQSSPSTSAELAPATAAETPDIDDTAGDAVGGWTGWLLRNYGTVQIVLTVNTALLWWLGTTEAVNTSLTYLFNSLRETLTGSEGPSHAGADVNSR